MTIKLSISMSSVLYDKLERTRQGKGMARSLAVQEAIESWVAGGGNGLDADYIAAYQREPEAPAEMDAWTAAGVESWSSDVKPRQEKPTQRRRSRAKG